jgi:hypothetical protein
MLNNAPDFNVENLPPRPASIAEFFELVRTCIREELSCYEEKAFARTKNAAAVLCHHRIHALENENAEVPEQFPKTRGELESADRELLVNLAQFYELPRVEGYPLVPLKRYLHILD